MPLLLPNLQSHRVLGMPVRFLLQPEHLIVHAVPTAGVPELPQRPMSQVHNGHLCFPTDGHVRDVLLWL